MLGVREPGRPPDALLPVLHARLRARRPTPARPWFAQAERALRGAGAARRSRQALAARQRWFELLGTLGGKWPHTQSVQPGGSVARGRARPSGCALLARAARVPGVPRAPVCSAPRSRRSTALRRPRPRWIAGRRERPARRLRRCAWRSPPTWRLARWGRGRDG
ncbi:MAG: hypothetical protein MZW92_57625 [Comamonadaceae bacterium]|nr:hypothetical protein [Comamonadaceae bacterium]